MSLFGCASDEQYLNELKEGSSMVSKTVFDLSFVNNGNSTMGAIVPVDFIQNEEIENVRKEN